MNVADLSLPLLAALPQTGTDADPATVELLTRARAGDREAFGEVLRPHLAAARRLAVAALGRPSEADEAVQEASIAAWRHLRALSADAAFRAWFLRIVWRKALDRRRSVRAWMARFIAADDRDGRVVVEPASSEAGPEAAAIQHELVRAAARIVRALPRRLRDPLLLAASGDHRYDEIAALLNIPVGSVKWRVSEARTLVRAKLERRGWGGAR